MSVNRIVVEKKEGFNIEARQLKERLINDLGLKNIDKVRIINIYDIEGKIKEDDLHTALKVVFSEPNVDDAKIGDLSLNQNEVAFRVEPLPGQYDQRADSAKQCCEIITLEEPPEIKTSQVFIIDGKINDEELSTIKKLLINPVESREVSIEKPNTIKVDYPEPEDIIVYTDFNNLDDKGLDVFKQKHGLAMTVEDLKHIKKYFKKEEKTACVESF